MVDEINAYIVQAAGNIASVNALDAQHCLSTYAHIYSTQYTCPFYRVSEHKTSLSYNSKPACAEKSHDSCSALGYYKMHIPYSTFGFPFLAFKNDPLTKL